MQHDTAWSGTHKTLVAFGCIEELVVVQDDGPLVLRSSTASHEQIDAFSTLSSAEHYGDSMKTKKKQKMEKIDKSKHISLEFIA